MEKQKMETADMVKENIDRIGKLFPHCVTETMDKNGNPVHAIDFDKLRQELGEAIVEGKKERYQFTWPMKSHASALANTPTKRTLRPDKESSKNFDTTENLYIEGDNLEVLKVLRETYLGKVKMIYIDPPYNTGKDFVYKDNRFLTQKEMDTLEGKYDEYGNIYKTNTESNGRFHTDWLNMMYPRLKVARDLLSDDGVIFISITDSELTNLVKICDEIFGNDNQLANNIWINGRTSSAHFTHAHEYILAYAKTKDKLPFFKFKGTDEMVSDRTIKKPGEKNPLSIIEFPAGIDFECEDKIFPNKFGKSEPVEVTEGVLECKNKKLANPVSIKAAWAMADMIKDWIKGNEVYDQKGQKVIRFFFKDNGVLQYEKDKSTVHPNTIIAGISTKRGSSEVDELLGSECFSFPKPTDLIQHLFLNLKDSDTVLDFFSGSGSTAHALMKLNALDGGKRKYILVQLPELTSEKSVARKLGYENICKIGEARIRKAGEKILKELKDRLARVESEFYDLIGFDKSPNQPASYSYFFQNSEESKKERAEKLMVEMDDLKSKIGDLDIGFRVLKLDSSNMKDVSVTPSQIDTFNFDDVLDNVKEGRTDLDLLFQIMLNNSTPLSANIEEQIINGHKIYNVENGDLIAVFDRSVDDKTITEIAKMQPLKFVMREPENSPDNTYNPDNIIDNFEQIFDLYSPNTIRRVL